MLPLWGILYGIAWIAWLICVLGSLGSLKLLGHFSNEGGYQYSQQYLNGIKLSQMGNDSQKAEYVH